MSEHDENAQSRSGNHENVSLIPPLPHLTENKVSTGRENKHQLGLPFGEGFLLFFGSNMLYSAYQVLLRTGRLTNVLLAMMSFGILTILVSIFLLIRWFKIRKENIN